MNRTGYWTRERKWALVFWVMLIAGIPLMVFAVGGTYYAVFKFLMSME